RRFSSRSSTNRNLTLSLDITNASQSEAYPELSSLHVLPVDALLADEFGEGFGVAGKAQALPLPPAPKTFLGQRILEEADGAILQLPVEVDEHVATRNELSLGKHRVRDQAVIREDGARAQRLVKDRRAVSGRVIVGER